jgi:NCS1 family nucleobase:cation symporter-1
MKQAVGSLFGIIITDYFLVKRRLVEVDDLYKWGEESRYWYQGGINRRAIGAFVPAAVVSVVIALVPAFGSISPFSWFIGVVLAAALYWVLMRRNASEPAPEGR